MKAIKIQKLKTITRLPYLKLYYYYFLICYIPDKVSPPSLPPVPPPILTKIHNPSSLLKKEQVSQRHQPNTA